MKFVCNGSGNSDCTRHQRQLQSKVFSSGSSIMLSSITKECLWASERQATNSTISRNMCMCNTSWRQLLTYALLLLWLSMCDLSMASIRNLDLFIEPPAVKRGQSVTLRCVYRLENDTLYSMKFYRGSLDFYRYMPGDKKQMIKVTRYPGINVNESASNGTELVLSNVSFALTGNFSCEVTCETPPFSTATAKATMHVVEFPDKRPQVFTDRSRYEPGQTLYANCSTPPSRPRAELRFTINNMPISAGEATQYIRTVDNLIASRLSLKLQLQSAHFAIAPRNSLMRNAPKNSKGDGANSNNNYNAHGAGSAAAAAAAATGSLLLRCTAQIGDLYQDYSEIELGTPQKDPIPARVTLSSSSGLQNFFDTYFSSSTMGARIRKGSTPTQLMGVVCLAAVAITALHWLRFCPSS